jgi:hypothetical protein
MFPILILPVGLGVAFFLSVFGIGSLVASGLTCYHPRHCGPYPAW